MDPFQQTVVDIVKNEAPLVPGMVFEPNKLLLPPEFEGEIILTLDQLKRIVENMTVADFVRDIRSPGHPDRHGHYQYTYLGRKFFPCDPRAEEVFIEDIAAGASRQGRFCGQTKQIMTIAEHQWHVSYLVPEWCALEGLLHDGAESYITDQIRPLKYIPIFGTFYLKVEVGIEVKIAERFKLTYPWPAEVMRADEFVSGAEVAQNINTTIVNHLTFNEQARAEGERSGHKFYFWDPETARKKFLARFQDLARARGVR